MALNFSSEITPDLLKAGWFSGRKVDLSDLVFPEIVMPHSTSEILHEMRDLKIPQRNNYNRVFEINPRLAADYDECLIELNLRIKKPVFPIGEANYDEFYIDEQCRVYLCNTIIGRYYLVANSFEIALLNFITGKEVTTQIFRES